MLSLDAKNSLEQATAEYEKQVDQVAGYLAARGISQEAAHTFRLGYVAEPLVGHERYRGRLAIPYVTPTCVTDVRFRAVEEDDSPKYLSREGAETHLYNVKAFEMDSDFIAICEGEMDTIISHGMCGIPTIGLAGANAWKPWYVRAFADYHKVFVLTDGDQPGRDLGKKIAQQIDVAVVVSMPDGMDVNDVFIRDGVEGVRGRIGL